MNKVNRSLKIKEGTRTRVNNELNFSNISVGDSFWVYASREEETNKSISIGSPTEYGIMMVTKDFKYAKKHKDHKNK